MQRLMIVIAGLLIAITLVGSANAGYTGSRYVFKNTKGKIADPMNYVFVNNATNSTVDQHILAHTPMQGSGNGPCFLCAIMLFWDHGHYVKQDTNRGGSNKDNDCFLCSRFHIRAVEQAPPAGHPNGSAGDYAKAGVHFDKYLPKVCGRIGHRGQWFDLARRWLSIRMYWDRDGVGRDGNQHHQYTYFRINNKKKSLQCDGTWTGSNDGVVFRMNIPS